MKVKQKASPPVATNDNFIFPPILEQVAIGVACVSLKGRWLHVNQKVAEITGYSVEELQQLTFQKITHPDDLEKDFAWLRRLRSGEIPNYSLEKRYIRKNGTLVWINIIVSLIRNANQEPEYFVVTIEDITERKQLEEERQSFLIREEEAHAQTQRINEQLMILQVITDTALAHLSLDPLFQAVLSQIRQIMAADNIAILLLDESKQFLTIRAVQGIEEVVATSVRIPLNKGFAGKIAGQCQPIVANDTSTVEILNPVLREQLHSLLGVPLVVNEHVTGVIHIGMKNVHIFTEQDIQLFQRVADRLALAIEHSLLYEEIQDARNEAIEHARRVEQLYQQQNNFVSVVSHEFRTTLTGIQGFSDILRSGRFNPEKITEYANDIYEDSLRLLRMINEILDANRLQAGKEHLRLGVIDLRKLLEAQAMRIRSITQRYTIRLEGDEQFPTIEGDTDKLKQVISNLLSNAVKYSPDGGEIVIRCTQEEHNIHLSVHDQGIGIPAQALDKIFTSYNRVSSEKTRHIKGTGLGLSIVKSIVELHHGKIWVESTPGQGSTFHILLPICQASSLQSKSS